MKPICIFLLALFSIEATAQKPYVNQEMELSFGSPTIEYGYCRSIVTASNNIVTLNNKNNGSNSDIGLHCVTSEGIVLWDVTCPSSPFVDDWGGDIALTSYGEIIVAGARYNGSNYDYSITKHSSSGIMIWQKIYHHIGNDIPTAIVLDEANNIYVTGSSQGTSGLNDFATIKLSGSDGSFIWEGRHDYVNKEDFATDIIINESGHIVVLGCTSENFVNSQFTLVMYHKGTGAQMLYTRHDSPGSGYDVPSEIKINSYGDYIVLGTANDNLPTADIKLVSFDNSFGLNWVEYYDFMGGVDKATNIILDTSNNIYFTGFTSNISGGTNVIVGSYSSIGDQNWIHNRPSMPEIGSSVGLCIAIDGSGDILSSGGVYENGSSFYRTAKYQSTGELMWEKLYGNELSESVASQTVIIGEDIITIGTTIDGIDNDFNYIKYRTKIKDLAVETDSLTGDPIFRKRELFVAIDPSQVNTLEVDEQKKVFWNLEEIVTPYAASSIRNVIGDVCGTSNCEITVYKVFKYLKSTDSTTTSRLNETIDIPDFWATFLFEFPEGVNVDSISLALDGLFPLIPYSHKNPIVLLTSEPNDTYFNSNQYSINELTSGDVAENAHINVKNAWDTETGKSFVRCGVFDQGIKWDHEDFGDGTISGTKITQGWSFAGVGSPMNIMAVDAFANGSHGTQVAGIIGALRNNNLGIAGIAGGDYSIENPGASIYSLAIFDGPSFAFESYEDLLDAIVNSSISGVGYRFGLNVSNHSWGTSASAEDIEYKIIVQRDAFRFANRMKVTQIAARGNTNNILTTKLYPASLHDDWILTVAQTGLNGQWKTLDELNYATNSLISFIGGEIDVSAPGSPEMLYTTGVGGISDYGFFTNSSASTPQVTGVVCLLMSMHNSPYDDYENLAPEDCENIISLTADDTDAPGFDEYTGYGRLNAAAAVNFITTPSCQLRHFGTDINPNTKSISLIETMLDVWLVENYQNEDDVWFYSGEYQANVYKVSATITHPAAIDGFIINAVWARHSSSTLFPIYDNTVASNRVLPREKVYIDSYNETSCNMYGYVYEVFKDGVFKGWWPHSADLGESELTYTMVRCTENLTGVGLEENNASFELSIYPNPTNNLQKISLYSTELCNISIKLVDQQGKTIREITNGEMLDLRSEYYIYLEGIGSGLYFYEVKVGDDVKYFKTIKQ